MSESKPVVLIVDDSLTVRMDLGQNFEAAGFVVSLQPTLEQARRALARGPVDLVVLDLMLPDGDGLSLLRELRADARTQALPVLLLSTEAEVRDRVAGMECGADDYVGKPYDVPYLLGRSRQLLSQRRMDAAPGDAPGDAPADDRPIVLLVDDSATVRGEVAARLDAVGFRVIGAISGEEGLQLAAALHPRVMIVDRNLPGIDGATVIRRLRLDAALRTTPCLLLTGSSDVSVELEALEAGADAFVRKHDDPSLVVARVQMLARAERGDEASLRSVSGPRKVLLFRAVSSGVLTDRLMVGIGDQLRLDGFDVVTSTWSPEAFDLMSLQRADALLLVAGDQPGPTVEICGTLKTHPLTHDLPLIVLSPNPGDLLPLVLATGADDCMALDSPPGVLVARLRSQVRHAQAQQEARIRTKRLVADELRAAEMRATQAVAEARAHLIAQLERKNRELDSFSYTVSHDLRAPLRGVQGFATALLEDFADALPPEALDHARRIAAAASRMDELIEDLLALARIETSDLGACQVDVTRIAREVLESLAAGDPARKVQTSVEEGLSAWADPRLLRIVFENVLANAWKFTARRPLAHITVGAGPEATGFFVRDDGAGFESELADRMFLPFQRLHSVRDFAGTGIGLATVERIISRHGGRVWATGAVGEGATIWFTLPRPSRGDPGAWP